MTPELNAELNAERTLLNAELNAKILGIAELNAELNARFLLNAELNAERPKTQNDSYSGYAVGCPDFYKGCPTKSYICI